MRKMMLLIASVLLLLAAAPSQAQPVPAAKPGRAFGFVTLWSGPGGKVILDIRLRNDGTTVANYRGEAVKGKQKVAFRGSMKGKITAKSRTLSGPDGTITLPKSNPPNYIINPSVPEDFEAISWGEAADGVDFKLKPSVDFDVPLVGFDVPLVGFTVSFANFTDMEQMAGVEVGKLSGQLDGIVVVRGKGNEVVVGYAVKTGGKLHRDSTKQAEGPKLNISSRTIILQATRSTQAQSGGTSLRKTSVISSLRVKVGSQWQSSSVSLEKLQ